MLSMSFTSKTKAFGRLIYGVNRHSQNRKGLQTVRTILLVFIDASSYSISDPYDVDKPLILCASSSMPLPKSLEYYPV